MIENEILLGNYIFASESIKKFINYTEIFKSIYGEYDYYLFLINFIEPLYISSELDQGRKLYKSISNEINSRLNTLISAKEDSNSTYLSELFDDEVSSAKSLLNIIKDYEKDEFYESEVEGLNDIIENFISK